MAVGSLVGIGVAGTGVGLGVGVDGAAQAARNKKMKASGRLRHFMALSGSLDFSHYIILILGSDLAIWPVL
jgi:hypothetical protein